MRERFWGQTLNKLREEERPGATIAFEDRVVGIPQYELGPDREIKKLVGGLTFDEMLEWCSAILPKGADINEPFQLAVALNNWAKARRTNGLIS